MRVVAEREFRGLARLWLAAPREGCEHLVEFVDTVEPGVPKERKWVLMISTQFGCPIGCRFCDAGSLGFHGDLSASEMLAQIEHVLRNNPDLDAERHPKLKIHFARMGEPSLNPAVIDALERLAKRLPGCMPSLSTVAPKTPKAAAVLERLREAKRLFLPGRFQLQFSLHSTDEARRRAIVPASCWSLDEIAAYGRRFVEPGDRKVTLNFALAPGESLDAERLAGRFPPDLFLVKVTPVNPTETAERRGLVRLWDRPPEDVERAASRLRALGFDVVPSPSLPEELAAASSCGQLWSAELRGRSAAGAAEARAREIEAAIRPYRRRSFPLRAERSGLLVVDMQRLFVDPASPSYQPAAREILPAVRTLVERFRKAGRPVFFTVHAVEDLEREGGLMAEWWRRPCLAGSPWAEVAPELGAESDRVLRKASYSAFSHPGLARALRDSGVEDIVVCGVATNLCVESTVRDAF
ncbi:MAG: isochorismatase family protein, partial [Elusimicrobia bacterium]|nr:isochorismatase family protein [Elusimicrobiota bacterium]